MITHHSFHRDMKKVMQARGAAVLIVDTENVNQILKFDFFFPLKAKMLFNL